MLKESNTRKGFFERETAKKQQAYLDSQAVIEIVTKRLHSGENVVFFGRAD